MLESLRYTIVDAFTDTVFRGNPAAVVVLPDGHNLGDDALQLIAREFNLSETAFVTPRSASSVDAPAFGLRWFTPAKEVALCGHATLASSHVLFASAGLLPGDTELVDFDTMSGKLTARKVEGGRIELELPAGEPKEVDKELEAKVKDVIKRAIGDGVNVAFVGVGEGISFETYMLIELGGPIDLGAIDVNPWVFGELAPKYRVMIVTTTSNDPNLSFVSRVFAPVVGIPEDPVTGSAHCMLGPYWQKRLHLQSGQPVAARQVSRRGGDLGVIWDEQKGTCRISGKATTAAKGELYLPA